MPDDSQQKPQTIENPYGFWSARFWHGMLFGTWMRLLIAARGRVSPSRMPMSLTITLATVLNSVLRPLQEILFGSYIARTQIKDAPIFIIGHWRSGTTLLHELLVLDERYTYPTTYECLAPNHFLVSSWLVTRLTFLLPKRRPMDNMETAWDKPQEDEFALVNMGLPSPYRTMAFPNEPFRNTEYLTFDGVPAEDVANWKRGLEWFLKRVTLRKPRRIILKSPPHTGRIKTLVELFPDARFVHIVRNPHAIFGSTVKLWKSLYKTQGLQVARHAGLEGYVFDCFERMYTAFNRDKSLVPANRLFEITYEDLVRDPIESMRSLYEHLNLGSFEIVQPKLEAYFADRKDYKTDRYQIDDALRSEIDRRWGPFMRPYGYCNQTAATVGAEKPT